MAEKNEITPEILKQATGAAKTLLDQLKEAAGRPAKAKNQKDRGRD